MKKGKLLFNLITCQAIETINSGESISLIVMIPELVDGLGPTYIKRMANGSFVEMTGEDMQNVRDFFDAMNNTDEVE